LLTATSGAAPGFFLRALRKEAFKNTAAEAERQRQRVNSDRSVEHKVMGNPRMAQPDKMPGGFFWGGASGKRAW